MNKTCLPLIVLLLALAQPAAANDIHPPADIRQTAEQFALGLNAPTRGRAGISAAGVDDRLRMPRCSKPLQAFAPPGARPGNAMTIGVRCTGTQRWQLYVPLRLTLRDTVLVAARPLRRGEQLSAADVRSEERDVSNMTHGYLTNVSELTGLRVGRAVGPGTTLTPGVLAAPELVSRGDTVTVVGRTGGIEVRMTALALENGAKHQRIRVRNRSSGKSVEAVVTARGTVEVDGL